MSDAPKTSEDPNDPFAPPVPREIEPRKGYTFDPVEPIPEHMQPAAPAPMAKRALRDVDTAEAAFRVKAFMWGSTGGIIFALGLGFLFRAHPKLALPAFVFGLVGGWAFTYFGVLALAERAGSTAGSLFFPSGKTTPGDRQYSLAQSYVARGLFDKAAVEYEACTVKYPDDPEPFMRLARLYRDELHRYDDAITWFKRATTIADIPAGTDMMAMRELIEVYTHRLKQPVAALPHLARLAARHPNTPAGTWAKQELAQMKAQMREETV
jgi:tetratricopeptide (TPR) repeat protein